jgi:hypothetical protein
MQMKNTQLMHEQAEVLHNQLLKNKAVLNLNPSSNILMKMAM